MLCVLCSVLPFLVSSRDFLLLTSPGRDLAPIERVQKVFAGGGSGEARCATAPEALGVLDLHRV